MSDAEIKEFVEAVKPIAFHVLYNSYEDEARYVVLKVLVYAVCS